jgi:hypothetical protein
LRPSDAARVPRRAASSLADVCLQAGDLESAESHALISLGGLEEGEINHAAILEILGEIARRSGDDPKAHRLFSNALRSYTELADGGGIADCLDGLSRLAAKAGDLVRAGVLHGAARQLRVASGGRLPARTDIAWPELPEDAQMTRAAMNLQDAVEYALASAD